MTTKKQPKDSGRHPDRDSMFAAVKTGRVPFSDHLKGCPDCREYFELLKLCHETSPLPKTKLRRQQIDRLAAIPVLLGDSSRVPAIEGRVVFDSWADLPALQLRQAASGRDRIIRLRAGQITVELVCDRLPEGWEFVAKIYCRQVPATKFVLKVGPRKLLAGLNDCYYWSSRNLPARLQLFSADLNINCAVPKLVSGAVE